MRQTDASNVGFTLIELMIVVAIIAILAVVAVPQFTKYIRQAKAAESIQMLDLLKKGGAAYYVIPRTATKTWTRVPCQFPGKVAVTPAGASCCDDSLDADGDERCDSNPASWDNRVWSALRFSLTDAHYFQYGFDSQGSLADARFTASAHADLDCDGIRSTYELMVRGDPAATESDCDTVSTAGVFRDRETE